MESRPRRAFNGALAALTTLLVLSAARPELALAQVAAPAVRDGQARDVANFEAVRVRGPVEVVLRQGVAPGVWVQASEADAARLDTRVVQQSGRATLEIEFKPPIGIRVSAAPRVEVDWTRLSAVNLQGSADLLIDGAALPALAVRVQGSGSARLKGVDTPALTLALSGSGDIDAEGRAGSLSISVAGSGDVAAAGLEADVVDVSIAGSGDVEVQARQTLSARVAGSGDLRYRGSPKLQSRVAGSGSVSPL